MVHQENYTVSNKIMAFVLLFVGLLLLFFAYQSSQGLDDQVSEAVTGSFTDSTIWFLILGIAAAVAGAGLLMFGKPARD